MSGVNMDQGKVVKVNGLEMYYEDYGEGHPLVLLHGGTGTGSANWEPYLPALSKEFRVITPDCRGHGRTNNPDWLWSYSVMADDIAAFIKELDLQKAFICGWSDGGQIGLELAMRFPGLASAYIVGAVWKDFTDVYLQTLKEWGFDDPGNVNISKFRNALPEYVDLLRSSHSPQGAEYWQELLRGISEMWLTPLNYADDDFKKIQEPMLIVIGDRDQFIPVEDAVVMYRLILNSEIAVVPGADHFLSLTKVNEFSDIVMGFLNRNSVDKPST